MISNMRGCGEEALRHGSEQDLDVEADAAGGAEGTVALTQE